MTTDSELKQKTGFEKKEPIVKKADISNLLNNYFQEYLKILKKYKYQRLDKAGQDLRRKILITALKDRDYNALVDFCTLMLYYGTQFTSQDLCTLKKEDVILTKKRVRLMREGEDGSVLLDEECSEVVKTLLAVLPEEQAFFLATHDFPEMTVDRVYKLIQQYQNDEIIEKLSHCFPIYSESDYEVIPTPLRLNANMRYTGKGVTIAFIDSGFYPHPDITQPKNRVLAYVNMAEPGKDDFDKPDQHSWHGMQTSLSAAGNGFYSNGLYRSMACDANLCLLKVSGPQGIETVNIIKAIEWCIKNRDEYNIRIMNISLGGDKASSFIENALDQAAEAAVQAGITVVVAAGNDGDGHNIITPPASAPSVITVGGLDDRNQLNVNGYTMYRSSYGFTLDGLMKPEIIAPGIWVAAPILPGTKLFEESVAVNELLDMNEADLKASLKEKLEKINLPKNIAEKPIGVIREALKSRLRDQKIVGTYYQHVDGTSFSSPIVASVIAQMIEANPNLNPRRIKQILTSTTDKLFNVPIERQGYGLIHARKAVKEAMNDLYRTDLNRPMSPYVQGRKVTFYCIAPEAHSVAIAGDFNGWNPYNDFMIKEGKNLWKLEKEFHSEGSYRYKFVIDGFSWVLDSENENREPDGYGAFNNRLNIFV